MTKLYLFNLTNDTLSSSAFCDSAEINKQPMDRKFLQREKYNQLRGLSLMTGYISIEDFRRYYSLYIQGKKRNDFLSFIQEYTDLWLLQRPAETDDAWKARKEYHDSMDDSNMIYIPEAILHEMLEDNEVSEYFEVRYEQFLKHANQIGVDPEHLLSYSCYPERDSIFFIVTPDLIKVVESIALAWIESTFDEEYCYKSNSVKWERINLIVGSINSLKKLNERNTLMGAFI